MAKSVDNLFGANVQEQEGKKLTMEKALEELFSNKQIELKSDISQRQILALSRGLIFADKYKSKNMKKLINNVLELSVSKKRKGRQEFVKVVQSGNNEDDKDGIEGLKSKLMR